MGFIQPVLFAPRSAEVCTLCPRKQRYEPRNVLDELGGDRRISKRDKV